MNATIAPATDKATRYVAIFEGKTPEDILTNETYWRPWLNLDGRTREYLPMMAAKKYLRERGGIAGGGNVQPICLRATEHGCLGCARH